MPAIVWSLLCAVALVSLGDLRDNAVLAVCAMLCWGAGVLALPRPRTKVNPLRTVFLVAMLLRVVLLASAPTLSDDIYRYVWEGTLTAHGGNPYLHAPADPALSAWLSDPNRALVNHPEVSSIYPPLAMGLFAVLSSIWASPLPFRVLAALADAGTAWMLGRVLLNRKQSLDGAWLYALLPLAAVESAGSGHLDAVALFCLAAAIDAWDRQRAGIVWAGVGALLKLLPGAMFLALLKRPKKLWPGALVIAVLAMVSPLPFAEAGPTLLRGLGTYTAHWSFNGSVFPVVELLLGSYARPTLVAVGGLVVLWAVRRFHDPAEVALWAGGAFVLLSPTVHPWYVGWAWVPAIVCGAHAWTLLAALMPLAYIALSTLDPTTGAWHEGVWPRLVIYGPFYTMACWHIFRNATSPGPSIERAENA